MENPESYHAGEQPHPREIDEAMLQMAEFVAQMADVEGYLMDHDNGTAMQLEQVELSMPIQLDMHVGSDGTVTLGGSPPLYYAETTILPVFHQLKIKIKLEKEDARSRE